MTVFINPGTEDIPAASEELAIANIVAFISDLQRQDPVTWERLPDEDYEQRYPGNGRFAFRLTSNGHSHDIQMPGLPLHRVQFGARDDDNPWHFPRLYVDDSSWLWSFALSCCTFGEDEDDDE